MNILVLGGTGFVGRYLIELLLKEEKQVTVLTRDPQKMHVFSKKVPFIQGDLLNHKEIELSAYTHIINCAGEIINEALMQQLHVAAIERMLNKLNLENNKAHWIQLSSVGVYGKVYSGLVDENFPFTPVGEYEKTKAEAELFIKRFCSKNKINYTIIRPSNVFGVQMPNQSLLQLVSAINRKLFVYIGKNSAEQVMNYVPVEDVAHLVVLCVENKNAINQEFNISDQLSIEDFVHIICDGLKIGNKFPKVPELLIRLVAQLSIFIPKIPIKPSRVDALTMRVTYSNKNAAERLDYRPALGIETALKNYITSLNI